MLRILVVEPQTNTANVGAVVMVTVKHILCPIDFSDFSCRALMRAAAIAKPQGSVITALHVVPLVPLAAPLYSPDVVMPPAIDIGAGERDSLLASLRGFVRAAAPDVELETDVVASPSVYEAILAQASERNADLIVMGTHGRTGFHRLLLGSVTERVLRTAHQPVLTVGLSATSSGNTLPAFKQIVCGVDFSDCSVAALGYALSLAQGATAHLTVVNVLEWLPVGYDPVVGPVDLAGFHTAVEGAARERLRAVVDGFAVSGLRVEQLILSGRPHHEILRIAAEQEADLIVLGIHGKHAVDRMLFGSTAEPVVRRAPCPVLTIRADVPQSCIAARRSGEESMTTHTVRA
jgi:nucleotide-binding universal stress UspA family protein